MVSIVLSVVVRIRVMVGPPACPSQLPRRQWLVLAGPCRGVDGALGLEKEGGRPRLGEGALLKPRRQRGWLEARTAGPAQGGESLEGRPLEGENGAARGPAQPPSTPA